MSDQPIVANPPVAEPGDRVILRVIEQEMQQAYLSHNGGGER